MRFFVLGDISVDLIYFLDRIPEPGEEVPARRALMKPGGAGATLAAHLASLEHKVYLAGRVGQDPFKHVALTVVEQVGVDLRHLQEDPENQTSSILILLTPGGERSMISAGGGQPLSGCRRIQGPGSGSGRCCGDVSLCPGRRKSARIRCKGT